MEPTTTTFMAGNSFVNIISLIYVSYTKWKLHWHSFNKSSKNFHDTGEIEAGVNDHDLHISFLKNLLGFSWPKTFWSVVTQDMFVKYEYVQ